MEWKPKNERQIVPKWSGSLGRPSALAIGTETGSKMLFRWGSSGILFFFRKVGYHANEWLRVFGTTLRRIPLFFFYSSDHAAGLVYERSFSGLPRLGLKLRLYPQMAAAYVSGPSDPLTPGTATFYGASWVWNYLLFDSTETNWLRKQEAEIQRQPPEFNILARKSSVVAFREPCLTNKNALSPPNVHLAKPEHGNMKKKCKRLGSCNQGIQTNETGI